MNCIRPCQSLPEFWRIPELLDYSVNGFRAGYRERGKTGKRFDGSRIALCISIESFRASHALVRPLNRAVAFSGKRFGQSHPALRFKSSSLRSRPVCLQHDVEESLGFMRPFVTEQMQRSYLSCNRHAKNRELGWDVIQIAFQQSWGILNLSHLIQS